MATVAQLETILTANTTQHDAAITSSAAKLGVLKAEGAAAGTGLTGAFSRMGQGAGGLLSSLGGLVPGIGAVTLGVGALVGGLAAAAKAAMEEQVGIAALGAALQANIPGWDGNTSAIERTVDARQKLSFSDDQLRASLAELVRHTHDVADAFDLQNLAMDLSRAKNIDLAAASTIVGKVSDGNTAILARYGVEVTKGASATEALAAMQKQFAGASEAYAGTAAGSIDRLKNAFDNAMETVGTKVLPYVQKFADMLTELLPKIADVASALLGPLLDAVTKTGDALNGLSGIVETLGHTFDSAWQDAKDKASVGGWNTGSAFVDNLLDSLKPLEGLMGIINPAFTHFYDQARDKAQSAGLYVGKDFTNNIIDGIVGAVPTINKNITTIAGNMAALQSPAGTYGSNIGHNWGSNLNNNVAATIPVLAENIATIRSMLSQLRVQSGEHFIGPLKPGQTGADAVAAEIKAAEAQLSQYYTGVYQIAQRASEQVANIPLTLGNGSLLGNIGGGRGGGGGGGSGKGGGGSGSSGVSVTQVNPLEEASKIAQMVQGAVTALTGLNGFKGVSDQALNDFFEALDGVINRMNSRITAWWGRWGIVQADIAKGVGDAVSGVLGAVAPLKSLADGFRPISDDTLDNFFAALDGMISRMQGRMELWWGRWGAQQAAIAKGVGDAIAGVLGAVAPLRTLADGFRPIGQEAMDNFFSALDYMLDQMQSRMERWWGRWGSVQADVAKGVGDAVNGVLGAVEPLTKLRDGFKPISEQAMNDFFAALDDMLTRLQGRIEVWWGRWGKVQSDIAKGAGDSVAGVLGALEPLTKLVDFKRPSQEAIDAFFQALDDFLVEFDRRAATFQEKAGTVAAELGQRIGSLVGGIGQAIDPLIKLADFQHVDPSVIESFMSNVWDALNQLKIVVEGFPAGFLDAAATWGAKLSSAFNGVKAALDTLSSLSGGAGGGEGADVAGPLGSVLAGMQALMGYVNDTALGTIDALKGRVDTLGTAFDTLRGKVHDDVDAILADLARLPGGTSPPGTPPTDTPPILPPIDPFHSQLTSQAALGGYGQGTVMHNPVFIGGDLVPNVSAEEHALLVNVGRHKRRREHGMSAGAGAGA